MCKAKAVAGADEVGGHITEIQTVFPPPNLHLMSQRHTKYLKPDFSQTVPLPENILQIGKLVALLLKLKIHLFLTWTNHSSSDLKPFPPFVYIFLFQNVFRF